MRGRTQAQTQAVWLQSGGFPVSPQIFSQRVILGQQTSPPSQGLYGVLLKAAFGTFLPTVSPPFQSRILTAAKIIFLMLPGSLILKPPGSFQLAAFYPVEHELVPFVIEENSGSQSAHQQHQGTCDERKFSGLAPNLLNQKLWGWVPVVWSVFSTPSRQCW